MSLCHFSTSPSFPRCHHKYLYFHVSWVNLYFSIIISSRVAYIIPRFFVVVLILDSHEFYLLLSGKHIWPLRPFLQFMEVSLFCSLTTALTSLSENVDFNILLGFISGLWVSFFSWDHVLFLAHCLLCLLSSLVKISYQRSDCIGSLWQAQI